MKKLSAVQLKQQALVMAVADTIEQQAKEQIPGMLQCWFSMEYHLFPSSLLLRFQFQDEASLEHAKSDLLIWQKRLSGMMLKKGVILKDMRKHLVFTLDGPEA
ncbi:putative orphan protein [Pseudoalteromonas luteoviolacea B = ATCC 29581]|nr:putative orphan protein [Pseudoalteromonas luteoviolacea B = ATCC 29581]